MELDAPPPAFDVCDELAEERSVILRRVQTLVDRITMRPGYHYYVGITRGMKYPYVQVVHQRPDANTGVMGVGKGGKSYITKHACDSEIFQRLLGLQLAYEEHEVREFFLVDGKRPYGPHIDVNALIEVSDRLDVRD